jgi:cathepsin X
MNTCRTCVPGNNVCSPIDHFPNASVAEYGVIKNDEQAIRAEIFARGPVATGLFGPPLSNYTGGIFDDANAPRTSTHAVSIVGWGLDEVTSQKYWVVRNSWGEYWVS